MHVPNAKYRPCVCVCVHVSILNRLLHAKGLTCPISDVLPP